MKGLKNGTPVVLLVLLSVVFSLAASPESSLAAQSKPQYGGVLHLSDLRDGISIGYPPKIFPVYGHRQAAPAVETLFRIDETGKPVPWLASRASENPSAKTLTLTLRKGIKFHDGSDFDATAVKWNLDQCLSVKAGGTQKFKSIDIVDSHTVRINLVEWDNSLTSNLAQSIGLMVSPTAYKKNGEEWCGNHPIGTGPFEFVSWEKDAKTVYKKFPGYWQKGKPYLDRIEWNPILDAVTRQLSLRKGEMDLAITIEPQDLAGLEKEGHRVTRRRIGSGAVALVPDSANPQSPFADTRVRQALQHAIDSEALTKTLFNGEAEATNQWIYKGHWGYNPAVAGYPYNPAKARQLLAEAGYPNGFKTKLTYLTGADQVFVAVQGYLKAIGIDAQLEVMQTGRYNQIAYEGAKWEGLVYGGVMANPDLASALASRYCGGGKFYSSMLVPDDYAKTVQAAVNAPSFDAKQKRVQEAMKLMTDKYALLMILYCRSDIAVAKPYLHNHGFFATPYSAGWTPEEAWLSR